MRTITILAALLVIAAAPVAAQPNGRDPLPRDERSLQRLNAEQLRIVRRASNQCSATTTMLIRPKRNPCVIAQVEQAVADSGDPALEAFNAALSDTERYDEYRSDTAWRGMLVEYRNNY